MIKSVEEGAKKHGPTPAGLRLFSAFGGSFRVGCTSSVGLLGYLV